MHARNLNPQSSTNQIYGSDFQSIRQGVNSIANRWESVHQKDIHAVRELLKWQRSMQERDLWHVMFRWNLSYFSPL